jgi:hypothetical protein
MSLLLDRLKSCLDAVESLFGRLTGVVRSTMIFAAIMLLLSLLVDLNAPHLTGSLSNGLGTVLLSP